MSITLINSTNNYKGYVDNTPFYRYNIWEQF